MKFHPLWLMAPALAGALIATPSDACTPVPLEAYLHDEPEMVPFDGVWLASAGCLGCGAEGASLDVVVTDLDGLEVAGTLEQQWLSDFAGYVIWRPDAPLEEGQTYAMDFTGLSDEYDEVYSFTAGPSLGASEPDIDPEVRTREWYVFSGPSVCCGEDGCGAPICGTLPDEAERTVGAILDWSLSSNQNQFLYRAEFSSGAEDFETEWSPRGYAAWYVPGDSTEICVDIISKHISSGSESLVFDTCVSLVEIEDSGREQAIADRLLVTLGTCESPGEYLEQWCSVFEEALVTGDCTGFNRDACAAALEECPEPSQEIEGPKSETGEDDSDESEAFADASGEGDTSSTSGCSMSGRVPRSGLFFWFFLIGAGALGRRRFI